MLRGILVKCKRCGSATTIGLADFFRGCRDYSGKIDLGMCATCGGSFSNKDYRDASYVPDKKKPWKRVPRYAYKKVAGNWKLIDKLA